MSDRLTGDRKRNGLYSFRQSATTFFLTHNEGSKDGNSRESYTASQLHIRFVSLLPLYFMIAKVGHDAPPAITHPEFYYGFLGLAVLWQFVFISVARDPIRYRPIMHNRDC